MSTNIQVINQSLNKQYYWLERPSSNIIERRQYPRNEKFIQIQTAGNCIPDAFSGLSRTHPGRLGTAGIVIAHKTNPHTAGQFTTVKIETDLQRWAEKSKELLSRQFQGFGVVHVHDAAAKLRVDRLTHIQAVLGLPMLELAGLLGITRQGLYKWLDASKEIGIHETNRQRLSTIEQLSKQWSARSRAPLNSFAHEPLKNGQTLLQLLKADSLNEAAIISAFDEVIEKLMGKSKTLSQRMVDAGFTRRPSARTLPADE